MERELIIPVKDNDYDRAKLDCEIATMKKLLPAIESFKTFTKSFEVFDIQNRKAVKRDGIINNVYLKGIQTGARYLIIGKN